MKTREGRPAAKDGGICRICRHDLYTRFDGKVRCSNPDCRGHRDYKLTSRVND